MRVQKYDQINVLASSWKSRKAYGYQCGLCCKSSTHKNKIHSPTSTGTLYCMCTLKHCITGKVRHFSQSVHCAGSSKPEAQDASVPTGMLTLDGLRKLVASGEIETVVMGFTDMVGRLSGKRYDADFFLVMFSILYCLTFQSDGIKGTHACSYLMTIDIEQKLLDGFEFSNW